MPDIFGSEIYDVPRHSSKCRILVYSHISSGTDDPDFKGAVNCSRDVIDCSTTKTIKTGGAANFTLVARRNYFNYIYPNDYVYIYFDPGDGRGFIRVFFGFIDRIERNITVGGNGETNTKFVVVCSDFTKAFDRTNVYFNPSILQRGDFASQHFGSNIGGTVLRSKGLTIHGSPAEVVLSLVQKLLGFGVQFVVPKTHPKIGARRLNNSRKRRFKNLLSVLASDYQDVQSPEELEKIRSEVDHLVSQLTDATKSGIVSVKEKVDFIKANDSQTFTAMKTLADQGPWTDVMASNYVLSDLLAKRARLGNVLKESEFYSQTDQSLLDLIDFRFMEMEAISGEVMEAGIYQSTGPLWSIMNTWANADINELFCDLRAVGINEDFDLKAGAYNNTGDELDASTGIQMIPALIMREHPFATIESVKTSVPVDYIGMKLTSVPLGGYGDTGIWSKTPNVPGRKVSTIQSLRPSRAEQERVEAAKHLDVCVITVQDIINEKIGRSDADVCNLIEVYADLGIGQAGKYMDNDVQPICTPVSVLRDGLRVRTFMSKFARWPAAKHGAGEIDSPGARFQTIRWSLLMDHWYQHNKEYLSGTITTRAFPEIRVGYRLDIIDRRESYYVEGASHNWSYTDKGGMLTSGFTLSRGQRNDPYPVYVLPALRGWGGLENRNEISRLADCFKTRNTSATDRSSLLLGDSNIYKDQVMEGHYLENITDLPVGENKKTWAKNQNGYLSSGATPNLSDPDKATIKDWERYFKSVEQIDKES